jgi:RDD family
LIDIVLAHLVIVVVFGWWALSPDSPVRFDGSLIYLERCHDLARTTPFLATWDKVQDCNTFSDFVFPNREIALQKINKTGAVTQIQKARFSLNRLGKGIVTIHLDLLMIFVLFVGASLFEASSKRATPGKRMLGLEVASLANGQVTIRQTLL